jgi:hypothetical protein
MKQAKIDNRKIRNEVYNEYCKNGQSAAFELAEKFGVKKYEHCKGCETETPVINHQCLICGQDTFPTPVKETEPAPTSQIIYVRNLDTGEIEDWTIGQLLHRINEDNATDGFNYNENDWEEGFKETLEGEFYSLFDEKGNLLNGITPTSKEGLEDSEIRVYGIDSNLHDGKIFDLTNNDFVHIAEEQGYVWTLAGFESAFNSEEIAYDMFIRFINPVKEQL